MTSGIADARRTNATAAAIHALAHALAEMHVAIGNQISDMCEYSEENSTDAVAGAAAHLIDQIERAAETARAIATLQQARLAGGSR